MSTPQKYTVHVSNDYNDPEWDLFLSRRHGGVLEQTCLWAKAKAVYGWQVLRFIVKHQDEIVAGFQILKRRVLRFGHIGYISKGPILGEYVSKNELIPIVFEQIKKVARLNRIHILIVHPPENDDAVIQYLRSLDFNPTKLVTVVKASLFIDLSQSLDDILQKMRVNPDFPMNI